MGALSAYRLVPEPFEQPSEFAARAAASGVLAERSPLLTAALTSVGRRLYGDCSEPKDLAAMADAIEALIRGARRRLGLPRFFWHRVFRCTI